MTPKNSEVDRGNQLEPGREERATCGPRDTDDAVLERLAERLEGRPRELGELVEEEHAQMGEARLAGTDAGAAADHRRGRGAVVGGPERRPVDEGLAEGEEAGPGA